MLLTEMQNMQKLSIYKIYLINLNIYKYSIRKIIS